MYHNASSQGRPRAVVKYGIKAIIEMMDDRIMKYKQLLIIQEPPVEFKQDSGQTIT